MKHRTGSGDDLDSPATMAAPSPESRAQLIESVRREIAADRYASDERLDAAVCKLVDELDPRPVCLSRPVAGGEACDRSG